MDKAIASRILESTRITSANKGPTGHFYRSLRELLNMYERPITPSETKKAVELLAAIFNHQPYMDMFSHIINGRIWQKKSKTPNDIRTLIDGIRSYILTNDDFVGKRGFGSGSPRFTQRRANKKLNRKTRKQRK